MRPHDDPVRDPDRLAALRRTYLLDTPVEEAFDRMTRLAARLLRVPAAAVSLIDDERQFLKSAVGVSEPWASTRQIPLDGSICQHSVASGSTLVVRDLRDHPLGRTHPKVLEQGFVAYAGVPLRMRDGNVVGTLCVMDSKPRDWEDEEVRTLEELASSTMTLIELRAAALDAERGRGADDGGGGEHRAAGMADRLHDASENFLERLTHYDDLVQRYDSAPSEANAQEEEAARRLAALAEYELTEAVERCRPSMADSAGSVGVDREARALWSVCQEYFEHRRRREQVSRQFRSGAAPLDALEQAVTLVQRSEDELRAAMRQYAEARHVRAIHRGRVSGERGAES